MSRMMRNSSHSSSATTNSAVASSPKSRLGFFSKKRQSRDEGGSSDKIYEARGDVFMGSMAADRRQQPQHSDKIPNSPIALPEIEPVRSYGSLPSPDSFIGATHDTEFLHLRENIRRLRKAPSGPDPKKVDAAWEIYKKLREDSLLLCKSLLQKSQNNHRNTSWDTSIGPLDTGSIRSGSINETSLPYQVNDQWLATIHEYKSTQEQMLDNLRTSLLVTYKSYDPEVSESQLEAFLADKTLRKNLVTKWRDASVHRMKSEKLLFWEQYRIRSLNYDKLKLDLQATESLFDVAHSGEVSNIAIREHVIAKDGDTVLEFANAASETQPILRFRVSSHLLAEASPYFGQALKQKQQARENTLDLMTDLPPPPSSQTCENGMVVNVYRMPQIELNNQESLTILLHAAHMHNSKVPREIDFNVFVSIAEVCLRYRCTSPLELQVEYQWLPQWMHLAGSDDIPDGLLLISYTFGLRGIFTRMSKTAILNAVDEQQIQSKDLWPQTVRDKIVSLRSAKLSQIQECCTNAIEEYFRPPLENTERKASVGSLILTATPRCPRGSHLCDATNLGWLMLVYNELRVLPSIMRNAGFQDLPKSPKRSIKELVDCLRLMPSAPQVHSGICDYAPAFRSAINDIYNSMQGLTLKDVSGKSGWALSKHAEEDHMSLDVHELPVPDEGDRQALPTMSSSEAICSKILMYLDNENDLVSAAMIDKGFYGAYKRNEAALLRNVMKARRRTMSTVNPEIALSIRRDIVSPNHLRPSLSQRGEASKLLALPDVKPIPPPELSSPYSPVMEETPMSAEEAQKILWPDSIPPSHILPNIPTSVENKEKYLMGDVAHIEDKARIREDTKHLRDEKDAALGLGVQQKNVNGPS